MITPDGRFITAYTWLWLLELFSSRVYAHTQLLRSHPSLMNARLTDTAKSISSQFIEIFHYFHFANTNFSHHCFSHRLAESSIIMHSIYWMKTQLFIGFSVDQKGLLPNTGAELCSIVWSLNHISELCVCALELFNQFTIRWIPFG